MKNRYTKIPKIIHYCWFGKKKKSKKILKCIESWKKFFPDFSILEWNESNVDINENMYIKKAYELKKWAFVSDFVRMKVLYEYGGIYFDTDVEVIKKFPSYLFNLNAFTGIESFSLMVNPGLVFACKPKNAIVGKMVESYSNDIFLNEKIEDIKTINVRITELLKKDGFVEEDKFQRVDEICIFPSSFFCPYDGELRKVFLSSTSLTVHHYDASWLPWYRKEKLFLGTVKRKFINFLKNR